MTSFGVDLHPGYQPSFSPRAAFDEGVEFAFVKTSQGARYVPEGFRDYFLRVEDEIGFGGFYHFIEAGPPGRRQAEHFLETAETAGGVDGRLVAVDFEDYGNRGPSNEQLYAFTNALKNYTNGHQVLAYSTRLFWDGGVPSGDLDEYDLDAAWEARVWTNTERRPRPKRFYAQQWLPWYDAQPDKGFGGRDDPLLRQFTWGAYFGGLYVDGDACKDLDVLKTMTKGEGVSKWLGPPQEPRKRAIPNGTWLERHPTRYGFDPDVRALVDTLFRNFTDISINTYLDHPEGWTAKLGYDTEARSIDVWHRKGRGVPILPHKGQRIVDFIFNDPNPPYVNWCIWRGKIWSRSAGGTWEPWEDDGTGLHFDHPHFTFMPRGWRP